MHMKAMVLTGIDQIEMVDIDKPQIQNDTDVLIRIATVGVCGSDVHYYSSGKIGTQIVEYPFIVGHECAGIVEAVGSDVTDLKAGDRIAVDPAISCFNCDQCNSGRHHTCRSLTFLGCPGQIAGCLCEYIVMPHANCYKLKDTMTMTQAAISEPLAIGVYAVKRSIPMKGAKVGILGAGPIGFSVLLPALAQGAEKIYVTDKIDARGDIAKEQGAAWTGNPDSTDIVAEINELERGQLDVVFDCCGDQAALDQALEILKPGGKLMLIGIPTDNRISFNINHLRHKEICIQNVRRQVDCVRPALDMIDDRSIDVDFMATHNFTFAQTKEAFDLVAGYKNGVLKAMIQLTDEGN
jgi:L-iditol 2-dehydrogenase